MITCLVTRAGEDAIRNSAMIVGTAVEPHLEVVRYEDALQRGDWQGGTIIFTDLERVWNSLIPAIADLWRRFEKARAPVRLLNHPTRSLTRYGLLRRLRELGHNDFDVYRADEGRTPAQFPVFLHGERDHNGPMTGALQNQTALDAALIELVESGLPANQVLVTELCDVRDADGLYRKYGVFVVGDRIVPRHVFFSGGWSVKDARSQLGDRSEAALIEEEREFVIANPHEEELRALFTVANIEYGRIDYGVRDGRIQVWEINTNPLLLSPGLHAGQPRFDRVVALMNERLCEALLALDGATDDQPFWIEPVRTKPEVAASLANRRRNRPGIGWRPRLLRR
ncbi:MAG: hypothetical protein WD044_16935 [Dongiaceae bacterium]